MCIHHLVYYEACGHFVKNTQLSLQSHCEKVDMALRYYNDQRDYMSAATQLERHYGLPTHMTLPCPDACPEVWPPSEGGFNDDKQAIAEYNQWVRDVGQAQYDFYKERTLTRSLVDQSRLDQNSERERVILARQHSRNIASHKSYPRRLEDRDTNATIHKYKLDHCMNLMIAQRMHPELYPRWNVIIHHAEYGCGRHHLTDCERRHQIPNEPQCPFLLAHRLQNRPPGHVAPANFLLKDPSASSRGGVTWSPEASDSTRAAMIFTGKDNLRCEMVKLKDSVWQSIFTPAIGPFKHPDAEEPRSNTNNRLDRFYLNPASKSSTDAILGRLGVPLRHSIATESRVEHGVPLDGSIYLVKQPRDAHRIPSRPTPFPPVPQHDYDQPPEAYYYEPDYVQQQYGSQPFSPSQGGFDYDQPTTMMFPLPSPPPPSMQEQQRDFTPAGHGRPVNVPRSLQESWGRTSEGR